MTETPKSPRQGKCESCQTTMDAIKLYGVLGKKMCASCGQSEIEQWNRYVAEAEWTRKPTKS